MSNTLNNSKQVVKKEETKESRGVLVGRLLAVGVSYADATAIDTQEANAILRGYYEMKHSDDADGDSVGDGDDVDGNVDSKAITPKANRNRPFNRITPVSAKFKRKSLLQEDRKHSSSSFSTVSAISAISKKSASRTRGWTNNRKVVLESLLRGIEEDDNTRLQDNAFIEEITGDQKEILGYLERYENLLFKMKTHKFLEQEVMVLGQEIRDALDEMEFNHPHQHQLQQQLQQQQQQQQHQQQLQPPQGEEEGQETTTQETTTPQ